MPAPKPLGEIIQQELTSIKKDYTYYGEELDALTQAYIQAVNKVLLANPEKTHEELHSLLCQAAKAVPTGHLIQEIEDDVIVARIMIGLDIFFGDAKLEPIDEDHF